MSLKIADLLELRCFRQATVAGGSNGLNKTISTISVLEYATADALQQNLLREIEFLGGEIVITSLADVRHNVDEQCTTIRRLAEVGEVGIILFYVGIIVPDVDKRLVKVADELDFPIIVMPENRGDLRYSEVIETVMYAIFRDQMSEKQFKNDILERISRLPFYQRSIETVLRLLSDRVKVSLLLTDAAGHLLNQASYPRSISIDTEDVISGKEPCIRKTITTAYSSRLELFIIGYDAEVSDDDAEQISDVLLLSANLWSRNHADRVLPELVKSILQDEPVKMRRIAEAFHIDVESIHNMWIITPIEVSGKSFHEILQMLQNELESVCKTIVSDIYNQDIVAFLDTPLDFDLPLVAEQLSNTIEASGINAVLTFCNNLADTAQVRRVYLQAQDALDTARIIFPLKKIFSQHEISFADDCRKLVEQGADAIRNITSLLDCLVSDDHTHKADLIGTLTVYLLDAGSDMRECSGLLFTHLNTIKYRLKRIDECIGFHIGILPETLEVFRAVAVKRLLVQKDK